MGRERLEFILHLLHERPDRTNEEIQEAVKRRSEMKRQELEAERDRQGKEGYIRGNESEARAGSLLYHFQEVYAVEPATSKDQGDGVDWWAQCALLRSNGSVDVMQSVAIPIQVKSSWTGVKRARERFVQLGVERAVVNAGAKLTDDEVLEQVETEVRELWNITLTRRENSL